MTRILHTIVKTSLNCVCPECTWSTATIPFIALENQKLPKKLYKILNIIFLYKTVRNKTLP